MFGARSPPRHKDTKVTKEEEKTCGRDVHAKGRPAVLLQSAGAVMGLEIEAKMKVDDLGAVREKLKAAGGKFVSRVMETNTFLDQPEGSLKKEGKGLRVRINRNVDTGGETVVVTFKGPLRKGAVKTREEREVVVENHDDAVGVFEGLGFGVRLSFEKRRETWELGECQVELDELPELGTFVEIEGESEEVVMGVRERLGLSGVEMGKDGYASMIAKYLQKAGRERELKFS